MTKTQIGIVICGALLAVILSGGCGGSGGPSGVARQVGLFATEDQNNTFSHLWVTVDHVEIVQAGSSGGGGSSTGVVVGTSTDTGSDTGSTGMVGCDVAIGGGRVVDLCSLNGAMGSRYLFLGQATLGPARITGVNVVVASQASIVPAGSSSAVAATFAGASGSTVTLSLPVTDANSLVVDFSLANWTLAGATLSAKNNQFLASGSASGLPTGQFAPYDYEGTVANLAGSAPNQQFGFVRRTSSVNVITGAATSVYNADGTPNPEIANGESVIVHGAFDSMTGQVEADDVAIQTATQSSPGARAEGVVSSVDAASGTITIQVTGADGFLPSTVSLQVTTANSTAFLDSAGARESATAFFQALTAGGTRIGIFGSVDGGTILAGLVKDLPPGS